MGDASDARKIIARLNALEETIPEAVMIGVYALGEAILADATERTPVDTGRLRDSGYCAPPQKVDGQRVEVGFGTDYAVAVHERTGVSHPVGEAKFLEKAVMNQARAALRIIVIAAEKYAGKGGEPTAARWPEEPQS